MKNSEINLFSKIAAGVVLGITVLTVFFAYHKLVVERDFWVHGMVPCDPANKSCFIHYCDPELEDCAEGEENVPKYFAFIRKNYKDVAQCDPATEDCPVETCEGSEGCEITYCSNDNEDGRECFGVEVNK